MESTQRTVKIDGVTIVTVARVENEKGWIELAYEAGALEFTILQITFHGDWKIPSKKLQLILQFATDQL